MASKLTAKQREQLHRRLDELLDRLSPRLANLEEAEEQIKEGLRSLRQAAMEAWAESADRGSASPARRGGRPPVGAGQ